MRGLMMLTTPFDMPAQSPYSMLAYGAGQSPWQSVVAAGNEIAITFPWYRAYDVTTEDQDSLTHVPGTLLYGRWFGTSTRHTLTLDYVSRVRQSGVVNPDAVFRALDDALARKSTAQFYPDYLNAPTEHVSVMAAKRRKPQRYKTYEQFSHVFEFIEVPNATIPSTIPPFI